jgi:CubicO group peptidase (beta-lactamase class C family)
MVALVLVWAGGQAAVASDPRIDLVEHGLVGKFYLAGAAHPTYSLAERMRFYHVPAVSIAVVDDYYVAWAHAYGVRDVASNAPAQATTLFQAASMSKPVAAAAILRFFMERGLSLDADVNTMLRSWRVPPPPGNTSERVTLRRLLSHSAGTNVSGFLGYDRDAPLPTLLQVLDGTRPANNEPITVTSVPGSAPSYSGGGTTIEQQLAVDVSGEAFPLFMRQTILGPLGMKDSTFEQPLPESLWSRAANGYYADGKPVHRGWHVYPTMAAAGLWTTAADLATFVVAIQNALREKPSGPIDASIAREMTTPFAGSFGLGLQDTSDSFSHTGVNEGFQGMILGLLRGGRGVVVMTNSDNGLRLANEIVNSVAIAYDWPVLRPAQKTALSLEPAALSAYAGSYHAQFHSTDVAVDIHVDGSELVIWSSADGSEQRAYAETSTRFFTLDGAVLVFSRNADGKVVSIAVNGFTFTRRP